MFVRKIADCSEFTAGDKSQLKEILNPNKHKLDTNYSLAWAYVKPGEQTKPHRLACSEVYFIINGSGVININNEEKMISRHDTVYIPPRAIQYISASAQQPLEFLCIVDPAWKPEHEEIL